MEYTACNVNFLLPKPQPRYPGITVLQHFMAYQVGAGENVDLAAQELARVDSPLVSVRLLVERDARNVPILQEGQILYIRTY